MTVKGTDAIDVRVLEDEAKTSEHKESYRELVRSREYRIGIGAKLDTSDHLSIFIEINLNLCPEVGVDISLMEKKLMLMKELEARGYVLSCDGENDASCEMTLSAENLDSEYDTVKSLINRIMGAEMD
jgi:hypothetical protein